MTKPTLYLFPDTNLFIQCLPLHELPWSELGDFEEIYLVVSRPVQREIDDQKGRGNGRVAQRARSTYPLFREIVTGNSGYEVVSVNPNVKVFIQSPSLPDEELSMTLDYSKPDDEIVGCCSRYKRENPALDVRLLTHDTGPMMSAKSVNLPFIPISNDWLIPPEHNESERKITSLENELARFKKAEPQFIIKFLNVQGEQVDSINFVHEIYEPLSDTEVSEFLEVLKDRFPIATNFNPPTPKPTSIATGLLSALWGEWEYVPAATHDIEKYQSEEYPKWLDKCENILSEIHEGLQRMVNYPSFIFSAFNRGTRPGNDSLVEIVANGNFKIFTAQYMDNAFEEQEDQPTSLPTPPKAPTGGWEVPMSPSMSLLRDIGKMSRSELLFPNQNLDSLLELPTYHGAFSKPRRDPNAFYYMGDSPDTPAKSLRLGCKQWLHVTEPKEFEAIITFEDGTTEVRGLVECVIRASNLSEPASKRIPVRIRIRHLSSRSHAEFLINGIDTMSILDD